MCCPEAEIGKEGQILVQPNFEVVFLAAAPGIEGRIARFAERKGRGHGVLFKITKSSVLSAAASRLTAEGVLQTLRKGSSRAIPENVAREIQGWFVQVRHVSLRSSVLIHCPDPETAGQVKSIAGRHVVALTDTVLELKDRKQRAALVRKLRSQGIFDR